MTTVIGIRHGEVHNPDGVIYAGLPGYGLSELGRQQAAAVGEALRDAGVVALYASPLDRGVETASAIADATGLDVITDDRLAEWKHWAQWAGMTWEQLRTEARDAWEAYRDDPGSVRVGETLEELADRVSTWLDDVTAAHGGPVVAVSHLEPLRAILLRRQDRPANQLFDITISPGHAVRIAPEADSTARGPDTIAELLSLSR